MNRDDELTLRHWLRARDPGPARAELREAARAVPGVVRPARFPGWDLTLRAGFGLAPIARPLVLIALVLAAVSGLVGLAVVQPWRPFPPRGLLAYAAPLTANGSSGIFLAATDGSVKRQISSSTANTYDHSPRWSADGRTLLFARTTGLDPLASCGGVGSVVLYDVATGAERIVATGLRPMNVIEWSPSGDQAAYTYPPPGCGTQVELGVVDLQTGAVTTTLVRPAESEITSSTVVLWHVVWTADGAAAVPDSTSETSNGRDWTTTVAVPAPGGHGFIRAMWTTPDLDPSLTAIDPSTGRSIDLGPGGVPTWSPDDTAVAFIRPGGPAGPSAVDYVRDQLVIVSADRWEARSLADVLVIDGPPADSIPKVLWTSDGGAIYWVDRGGGVRVVDVRTGRSADLVGIAEGCSDPQWQPVPG